MDFFIITTFNIKTRIGVVHFDVGVRERNVDRLKLKLDEK
jgi:hypothetical protein